MLMAACRPQAPCGLQGSSTQRPTRSRCQKPPPPLKRSGKVRGRLRLVVKEGSAPRLAGDSPISHGRTGEKLSWQASATSLPSCHGIRTRNGLVFFGRVKLRSGSRLNAWADALSRGRGLRARQLSPQLSPAARCFGRRPTCLATKWQSQGPHLLAQAC